MAPRENEKFKSNTGKIWEIFLVMAKMHYQMFFMVKPRQWQLTISALGISDIQPGEISPVSFEFSFTSLILCAGATGSGLRAHY